MDEGLSHSEWMDCFRSKIPSMKQDDCMKAWTHASMRMNAQYSWETLHHRLDEASPSKDNIPAIFFTILVSEDPSNSFVFKSNILYSFPLNVLGNNNVFSIQHRFDLCNIKRRQSMCIPDDEFVSVCQNCETKHHLHFWEHEKYSQTNCWTRPKWMDQGSDPPKLAFTNSLPQTRESILAFITYCLYHI